MPTKCRGSSPVSNGCANDRATPTRLAVRPSTPPPLSPTHPTPESTGLTSSQSSRESTSTPTSADSTQGSSSTSTISGVSSYPGSPVTNFSTASNPTPTPIEPSPAAVTQNSGISAGSAVGIALGVFVGASILVAAALFLFLRERKRRRNRDSMPRKLTSPEGAHALLLVPWQLQASRLLLTLSSVLAGLGLRTRFPEPRAQLDLVVVRVARSRLGARPHVGVQIRARSEPTPARCPIPCSCIGEDRTARPGHSPSL